MRVSISSLLLTSILTMLLLAQCTYRSNFYAPNTVTIPALQQSQDATVSVGVARGSYFGGWEANATYSPMKHIGLMFNHIATKSQSNGSYYYYPFTDYARPTDGQVRFTEGGLGTYFPVSPKHTLSCWAGYGEGRVKNGYAYYLPATPPYFETSSVPIHAELNYRRWSVQPSWMMRGRYTRFGAALRLSRIEYTSGQVDYRLPEEDLLVVQSIEKKGFFLQPELGVTFQLDLKPFTMNYSFTTALNADQQDEYHFAPSNLSVSLGCDLQRLWRKQ